MKKIVCDTGPILHLWEPGLLDLLAKTGKVFIPKMVNTELIQINRSWKQKRPSWIYIEPLSASETSQVELLHKSGLVDIGEAEAIILALDVLKQIGFSPMISRQEYLLIL